jgi:acyl-CoA hydrolase
MILGYIWETNQSIINLFLRIISKFKEEIRPILKFKSKKSLESQVELIEVLKPSQVNSQGYAFGGVILSWIDHCAVIASQIHSESLVTTASIDEVHFIYSVKKGTIATIRAQVTRSWNSSMEADIDIETEDLITGEKHYCCKAYVTLVAIDKDSKPTTVPRVIAVSELDSKRYEEAEKRKNERLRLIQKYQEELNEVETKELSEIPPAWNTDFDEKGRGIDWSYSSDSLTEVFRIILPKYTNPLNTVFGGRILRWMETYAMVAATRHCKTDILTANIDLVRFLVPMKIGDVIRLQAFVTRAFNTSIEVYVRIELNPFSTGKSILASEGYLTMVSLDKKQRAKKVPKIRPRTQEEIAHYMTAPERRKYRLSSLHEYEKSLLYFD